MKAKAEVVCLNFSDGRAKLHGKRLFSVTRFQLLIAYRKRDFVSQRSASLKNAGKSSRIVFESYSKLEMRILARAEWSSAGNIIRRLESLSLLRTENNVKLSANVGNC